MAWLEALRTAVKESSQSQVARELNLSSATISQVLSGKYAADTKRIEQLVRGRYMHEEVFCPVAGMDITRQQCAEFQCRPFAATNHLRVRFYQMCPSCSNYLNQRKEDEHLLPGAGD
jgi:predicted transcriptional regulator